jgi:hypothetical protein
MAYLGLKRQAQKLSERSPSDSLTSALFPETLDNYLIWGFDEKGALTTITGFGTAA